jgi:hypothetical protein
MGATQKLFLQYTTAHENAVLQKLLEISFSPCNGHEDAVSTKITEKIYNSHW